MVHPKLFHLVVSASRWSWGAQVVPDGAEVMICSRFDARKILFCHDANI